MCPRVLPWLVIIQRTYPTLPDNFEPLYYNLKKIKSVVFGRLEGTNKRGRPHKEWMDNILDWCGASIQELYHAALEKQKWRRITRTASGTYTGIGPLVNDDDDYNYLLLSNVVSTLF